jgi:hypothetical protein
VQREVVDPKGSLRFQTEAGCVVLPQPLRTEGDCASLDLEHVSIYFSQPGARTIAYLEIPTEDGVVRVVVTLAPTLEDASAAITVHAREGFYRIAVISDVLARPRADAIAARIRDTLTVAPPEPPAPPTPVGRYVAIGAAVVLALALLVSLLRRRT